MRNKNLLIKTIFAAFCSFAIISCGEIIYADPTPAERPEPGARPTSMDEVVFNVSIEGAGGIDMNFDSKATVPFRVIVETNVEFEITEEASWAAVRFVSEGFEVEASRNKTLDSRTGTLTVTPVLPDDLTGEGAPEAVVFNLTQNAAQTIVRDVNTDYLFVGLAMSRNGRFITGGKSGYYWIIDTENLQFDDNENVVPFGLFTFPFEGQNPGTISNNGNPTMFGTTADGSITTSSWTNHDTEQGAYGTHGIIYKNGERIVLERADITPGGGGYNGAYPWCISDNAEYIACKAQVNATVYIEGGWRLNKATDTYEFSWYGDDPIEWYDGGYTMMPEINQQVYSVDPEGKFTTGIMGVYLAGDIYYRDLSTGVMTEVPGFYGWLPGPINSEGKALFYSYTGGSPHATYGNAILMDLHTGEIQSLKEYMVEECGLPEEDYPASGGTVFQASDDLKSFCWSIIVEPLSGLFSNHILIVE